MCIESHVLSSTSMLCSYQTLSFPQDVGEPEFSIFTTFPVKPGMTLAKTPQAFLKDLSLAAMNSCIPFYLNHPVRSGAVEAIPYHFHTSPICWLPTCPL